MPHNAAFGRPFQSRGNKNSDASLHSFPRKRRAEWEEACGRTELPKDLRLCSQQFCPKHFESFRRPQLVKELADASGYKRRLNPDTGLVGDRATATAWEPSEGPDNPPGQVVRPSQRDAVWRLTQQEAAAAVLWDHDYAVNSATFTEEQTLDHNYTHEYQHMHPRSPLGSRRFASSDKEIHFHTGFATYQLLSAFWELVEPGGADLGSPVTTSLLPFDELLLFLMHLSRGPSLADLSQRFGIESAAVSGVISSWTHFLYRLLGSQRLWIAPEAVRAHLPPEFSAFSDTQVVLHCVQIFCRARLPLQLQSKAPPPGTSPASFKALVGLAPHGAVTFVSGLFARSVRDLDIFCLSGVTQLLTADAALMVDRGFLIDHLAPCKVHRPAFFYQHAKTSTKRRRIPPSTTRLKIHVWRCLARLKQSQLFNKSAPLPVWGGLEELFSVACYLVNYQKRPRRHLRS